MKRYEVDVTVSGAKPPRGRPIIAVTFIVPAESPDDAKRKALEYAERSKQIHPMKYRGANFSVSDENIKVF